MNKELITPEYEERVELLREAIRDENVGAKITNNKSWHEIEDPLEEEDSFYKITKSDCDRIKELVDSGMTMTDVADEHNVSRSTISHHYHDKCTHKRSKITPEMCADIRMIAKYGVSFRSMAEYYPVENGQTLSRHAYGKCKCAVEELPVKNRRNSAPVDIEECREIRDELMETKDVETVANKHFLKNKLVKRHGFGNCVHGDHHPAVDYRDLK